MTTLRANAVTLSNVDRSELTQENLAVYPIPWVFWRVSDAMHTNLPGTASGDDLGLYGGTFGTDPPSLQTQDLKAAGASNNYARCQFPMPVEYVAGQSVALRFSAAMLTTIADTSATLDCSAYLSDREIGIGSDLVTTAATSINSLTFSDVSFTVSSSGLSPGDLLDIRIQTAVNDGASGTAVIAAIGATDLLCDIRG